MSYLCVESGESLPTQFCDQKILLQKWHIPPPPHSSQHCLSTSCLIYNLAALYTWLICISFFLISHFGNTKNICIYN